nr:hypothetical protein GCM10025732_19800 [Glycomyces mayteni]
MDVAGFEGGAGVVGVVGVDEDLVGEGLDLGADAVEGVGEGGELGGVGGAEAQFDDLFGDVGVDELAGEPEAMMRPSSMTTRRSQSCSASSM